MKIKELVGMNYSSNPKYIYLISIHIFDEFILGEIFFYHYYIKYCAIV